MRQVGVPGGRVGDAPRGESASADRSQSATHRDRNAVGGHRETRSRAPTVGRTQAENTDHVACHSRFSEVSAISLAQSLSSLQGAGRRISKATSRLGPLPAVMTHAAAAVVGSESEEDSGDLDMPFA